MSQEDENKGKKVYICAASCVRRNLDAKKISTYLILNNYSLVKKPSDADFIIFFTCGVSNLAADRCLKGIKNLQRYDAELIVAGCLPEISPGKVNKFFNGKILTTKNINDIDTILPYENIKLSDIEDEHLKWVEADSLGIVGSLFENIKKGIMQVKFIVNIYLFIKKNLFQKFFGGSFISFVPQNYGYTISISRGCIHNCSYCAIWKAIGKLESKPINQCIKEFKDGLSKGEKKFIISADDIGPYGIDIGTSLPKLLDEMTKIKGDYIIDIRGTHPKWIIKYIDELEPIFKRRKIKHLLLCVQSGNDRILKLMRRNYDIDSFVEVAMRLKKAEPDLKLRTHIILGFPSETRVEFEDTLKLVK